MVDAIGELPGLGAEGRTRPRIEPGSHASSMLNMDIDVNRRRNGRQPAVPLRHCRRGGASSPASNRLIAPTPC